MRIQVPANEFGFTWQDEFSSQISAKIGNCKLQKNMKCCTISQQAENGILLRKMLTSMSFVVGAFRHPYDSSLIRFWQDGFKCGSEILMIQVPGIYRRKAHNKVRESIELAIIKSIVDVFPVRFRCCEGFKIQVLEGADIEIDE